MKKFTKICLAIALVTFLTGCLLGCVGVMLGGLRQLEHVRVESLTGFPFRFFRNRNAAFFGFGDDEWEEHWNWRSSEWKEVESSGHSEHREENGTKTGLTEKTLTGLELATGACRMYIEESSDDQVKIVITGECENHYQYRIEDDGKLLLAHQDMDYEDSIFWNRNHPKGDTVIMLYLPADAVLDDIEIDFGAGELETGYLRAREIEINVGAADCFFEGIEAEESVEISMGAGKITANALITQETVIEMGAGELQVSGARVSNETQVGISMGNATLNGTFAGDLDVECSMGSLDLILAGKESDYNYEIDCGMGSIRLGDREYTGLATEHKIKNGSSDTVDISCSMGSVKILFAP